VSAMPRVDARVSPRRAVLTSGRRPMAALVLAGHRAGCSTSAAGSRSACALVSSLLVASVVYGAYVSCIVVAVWVFVRFSRRFLLFGMYVDDKRALWASR
jgi:hypothetical protein